MRKELRRWLEKIIFERLYSSQITKLLEKAMFIETLAVCHDGAHDNIGMAVDVFGERVEDGISAQCQRTLEDRRHEL